MTKIKHVEKAWNGRPRQKSSRARFRDGPPHTNAVDRVCENATLHASHCIQTTLSVINYSMAKLNIDRRTDIVSLLRPMTMACACSISHWASTTVERSWPRVATIDVPWWNFQSPEFGAKFRTKYPYFRLIFIKHNVEQVERKLPIRPAVSISYRLVKDRQTDRQSHTHSHRATDNTVTPVTRSPAVAEGPREHTVSWNLVKYCTNVRRIALEKACNWGITFKVIQGH